jgi:hypothetical protein
MPNHKTIISSIVPGKGVRRRYKNVRHHQPKGTAPEEPADRRKKFNKKTMMKINLHELHPLTSDGTKKN